MSRYYRTHALVEALTAEGPTGSQARWTFLDALFTASERRAHLGMNEPHHRALVIAATDLPEPLATLIAAFRRDDRNREGFLCALFHGYQASIYSLVCPRDGHCPDPDVEAYANHMREYQSVRLRLLAAIFAGHYQVRLDLGLELPSVVLEQHD